MNSTVTLDKIVSLCKRRGFIFPGSEIYGGLANTWDYGPLGAQLKKNVKDIWWREFVEKRQDMVGLDSSILMNPKVWEASGHLTSFSDPLIECKKCHYRSRADKLMEENVYMAEGVSSEMWLSNLVRVILRDYPFEQETLSSPKHSKVAIEEISIGLHFKLKNDEKEIYTKSLKIKRDYKNNTIDILFLMYHFLQDILKINCPNCGKIDWTEPKQFNLMFKTQQGVIEGEGTDIYLRPETAQGIFVNFKNILDTTRKKLPFGVGQIGKAFRNEITPGNFTFRTREFEQMEIEYFIEPGTENKQLEHWKQEVEKWFEKYGIQKENLRFREHSKDELSHYSSGTYDIEYKFPWGWGELAGIASRTDFDLKAHEQHSSQDLKYTDPYDNAKKFIPYVIEPSFGCDRTVLIFLMDAYTEETLPDGSTRVVLKFHKQIAPIKAAVLPLKKNEEKIVKTAKTLADNLTNAGIVAQYDDTAAIGKLYRRQDEIGTPYCITVDFDTLENETVTIRDRDTMKQERIAIKELVSFVQEKIGE